MCLIVGAPFVWPRLAFTTWRTTFSPLQSGAQIESNPLYDIVTIAAQLCELTEKHLRYEICILPPLLM
jgi:branched-subunit amino acid permease